LLNFHLVEKRFCDAGRAHGAFGRKVYLLHMSAW
jgi:hypothetical protein